MHILTMDSTLFSLLALPAIVFYAGYTTFIICQFLNKEFFRPNMKVTDLDTLKMRAIPPLAFSGFLSLYTYKNADALAHTWVTFYFNMASYLFFVELSYYIYHRLVHTRFFYKMIHSYHHTNINTYPIDFLYANMIDFYMYMVCLHIPTFILPMNISEYLFGIYFFTTMGFISHSDILITSHNIHHRYMVYNYGLVFPIFDKVFNTYRISN
jgi:sterol desaturase/sphingolipid hydroxylase (fatty acid hydroxylase superfamily)